MRNLYITLGLFFIIGFNTDLNAQFSTSNSAPYNSPYYLINDVFAGGNVTISNVTAFGAASQMGFFSGNSVLGLDSGVVLSTGTINELCQGSCPLASTTPGPPGSANGTNFGFSWMGATTGATTNNNLYNVSASVPTLLGYGSAPNDVNDAAVISFDFVPTLDTMHFRFIFASKEWPSYPCSSFNDVFGFFVSGPGITGGYNSPVGYPNGAQNFANIPGTNIPITITSINATGYSPSSCTNSYPQYFVPNVATSTGITAHHTTIMEVEFVVQPCQTYNFTMGIADGSDGALSSFVLMEANSFNSSGVQVAFNASYNLGGDSILYEGCGSVDMSVVRADNIQNSDTIHFNISGNATNGIDYTLLPDSVVFVPGQTTFNHTFSVPNDFITEGPETIMVFVTDTDLVTCTGTGDTLMIVIQDPIPLLSDAWTDTVMCTDNNTQLATNATGLSPFNYIWNTGLTTDTITINPTPTVSTDYYVTITDACSLFTIIDTAHLVIQNPVMSIHCPGDTITCEATGTVVNVQTTNQMPGTQFAWNNPGPFAWTSYQNYASNPLITTNYIVTVSQACSGQMLIDTFTLVVDNPPFTVTIDNDTINCTDGGTTLSALVTNTTPSFVYQWGNGATGLTQTVNPSVTTTYYFTATDACGVNSVSDSATVYVINSPMGLYTPNKSIQCAGDTVKLEAFASGGYAPYSYLWSGGGTDSTKFITSLGNAIYTVSVTDICGIDTIVSSVNVNLVSYPPLVIDSLIGDTFNCINNVVSQSNIRPHGGSGDYQVSWDQWATTHNYFYAIVDSTTTFTVQAVDLCNNDSTLQTITYVVLEHDPLVVSLPKDTNLCPKEELVLNAVIQGGAGNYSYKWNTGEISSRIIVKQNTNQMYSVTVTDDCKATASNNISIYISQPSADFEHLFFDAFSVGFQNKSEYADTYFWKFGDGDTSTAFEPLKTYEKSQEYNVFLVAIDSVGCTDTAYYELTPPLVAFVPNAFTPFNKDGLNDYFELFGEGFKSGFGVKEFRIEIYDRWGGVVFSSLSSDFKWDGTLNGKKLEIGPYTYIITVEGYEQQKIDLTGTINIIN